MKDNILKFIKDNKVIISLFIILMAVHLFLPLNWADDAVFLKKAADKDILTFLNGSARPFTDGFTYVFSRNQWLWRILNPLVLTACIWSVHKTAPLKTKNNKTLIMCSAVLFPTFILVDAGFIATTVNYLWPVTFGILNLIPSVNSLCGKKTNKLFLLSLIPLLVYATNMQQLCAVLLAIFMTVIFYLFFKKKKIIPFIFMQFLITVAGTFFSLYVNFTGDNSRISRETGRYFPDFGELNFVEKFDLGFSSTFYCMTMEIRQAFAGFIIFAILLAVFMFKTNKNAIQKAISLIPAVFSLVFGIVSLIPDSDSVLFGFLTNEMYHPRLEKAVYSFNLIPDILFAFVCIISMYSIWVLIDNIKYKIISEFIFLLGLGSRILMGFSPTVWASGYRTFCIFFISFIYISLIIIDQSKTNSIKGSKKH